MSSTVLSVCRSTLRLRRCHDKRSLQPIGRRTLPHLVRRTDRSPSEKCLDPSTKAPSSTSRASNISLIDARYYTKSRSLAETASNISWRGLNVPSQKLQLRWRSGEVVRCRSPTNYPLPTKSRFSICDFRFTIAFVGFMIWEGGCPQPPGFYLRFFDLRFTIAFEDLGILGLVGRFR